MPLPVGVETEVTTQVVCNEQCVRTFLPVCGSDGNTYNNLCLLEVAACKGGVTITPQYEGPCGGENPLLSQLPILPSVLPMRPRPRQPVLPAIPTLPPKVNGQTAYWVVCRSFGCYVVNLHG